MAAQGFSVVEIAKEGSQLAPRQGQPVQPAHLDQRADAHLRHRRREARACAQPRMPPAPGPSARFNNCAGGTTPWGTMLDGGKNIQNYFPGDASKGPEAAARKRYNISGQRTLRRLGAAISTASTSTRSRTRRTASAGSSRSIPTTRTTPR